MFKVFGNFKESLKSRDEIIEYCKLKPSPVSLASFIVEKQISQWNNYKNYIVFLPIDMFSESYVGNLIEAIEDKYCLTTIADKELMTNMYKCVNKIFKDKSQFQLLIMKIADDEINKWEQRDTQHYKTQPDWKTYINATN